MKLQLTAAVAASVLALAGAAHASIITFTPDSNPGVAESPAFGPLAAGGAAADNYIDFGVDFTFGNVEGYFDDPPHAFGGVNGSGDVDLLADVDGQIVRLGTHTAATTSYFYAEAGYADVGTLTLTVFDSGLNVIGTALNGLPTGDFGRTTFAVSTPGIAYFRISGNDSYGVDQIRLATPGGAPEPAAWALMIAGFGLAGGALRTRRKAPVAA